MPATGRDLADNPVSRPRSRLDRFDVVIATSSLERDPLCVRIAPESVTPRGNHTMKSSLWTLAATLLTAGLLQAQAPAAPSKLVAAQDAARSNTDFQARHFLATTAIAKAVGAPLGPLTDAQGNALPANQAADKLAADAGNKGSYREVTPDEAQKLANQGTLVIVAWSNPAGAGHLATVRAEGISGDQVHAASREPLINNVGVDVGIEGVNWVFRKDATIHYYTPGAPAQ